MNDIPNFPATRQIVGFYCLGIALVKLPGPTSGERSALSRSTWIEDDLGFPVRGRFCPIDSDCALEFLPAR
jgi:hypothetical protein